SHDFLIQKIGGDARNVTVHVNGQAIGVLVRENVATGKCVGGFDAFLPTSDIVGLNSSDTEGVQIKQCGVAIRMIVASVPIRFRILLRKQGVEKNTVLSTIAISLADLGDDVNEASASGATCQSSA